MIATQMQLWADTAASERGQTLSGQTLQPLSNRRTPYPLASYPIPKPETLNSYTQETLNPLKKTLNPQPRTANPKPSVPLSTLPNPKP